jgi:chemotaxis protein histidine kinase CheA
MNENQPGRISAAAKLSTSFKELDIFSQIQFETEAGSDPNLLGDFIGVARENLSDIAMRLQWLERDPSNAAALQALWRNFYTIKSLAGFLNLSHIAAVAQEFETLFDQARSSQLTISPEHIETVLDGSTYLHRGINALSMFCSPDAGIKTLS